MHNHKPIFSHVYLNTKVHMIPCRSDNYSFVLETQKGSAIMVDSTLKEPVMNFLDSRGLDLKVILLTHHHYDHVDKIDDFQDKYSCEIYCSGIDSKREDVQGQTKTVQEKDLVRIEGLDFEVIETPGHTKSHLSYFLKKENLLFCGDLLFSLGCGRVFEPYDNVYDDFFKSFQKLKSLCNDETLVYCAHEYTQANLKFLKSQGLAEESTSKIITERLKVEGKTVPTTIGFEKNHNAFFNAETSKDFMELRLKKDQF